MGIFRGTSKLVPHLNKIQDDITARTLLPGLGYRLRPSKQGVALEILPPATSPATPTDSPFKIRKTGERTYKVGGGRVEVRDLFNAIGTTPGSGLWASQYLMLDLQRTIAVADADETQATPNGVTITNDELDTGTADYGAIYLRVQQGYGITGIEVDMIFIEANEYGGAGRTNTHEDEGPVVEYHLIGQIAYLAQPTQLIFQHLVGHYTAGAAVWCGTFNSDRYYWPGDIVRVYIGSGDENGYYIHSLNSPYTSSSTEYVQAGVDPWDNDIGGSQVYNQFRKICGLPTLATPTH
jgi:hypothetical protein